MLYLTRKLGEKIIINNDIEIEIIETKAKSVKLGFKFPSENSVLRKEIYDLIKGENISATEGSTKDNEKINFKEINLSE